MDRMNQKRIRTLAVATLLITALCAMATMPAAAATREYTIFTGEEICIFLTVDENDAVVYYSPQEQGNRMFKAWHTAMLNYNKAAGMTFYWTDTSVSNHQWHAWRNACVGFYWPKTTQNLYSGSNTIAYKFGFRASSIDDVMPVRIKIS